MYPVYIPILIIHVIYNTIVRTKIKSLQRQSILPRIPTKSKRITTQSKPLAI